MKNNKTEQYKKPRRPSPSGKRALYGRHNPYVLHSPSKVKPKINKKDTKIQELVSGSVSGSIDDIVKPPKDKNKVKKSNVKHKLKSPPLSKPPTKKEGTGVFKQLKDKLKGK